MKLKKLSNKLKSLFQDTASHGGCRLLSVVLAALLCCGANSQVVAASMPIGANYAADPTSSTTSSDQLDVTGMLRENAPDTSNQQPWTLTQRAEGLFVGLATLAGLVAGGRMIYNRNRPNSRDSELSVSRSCSLFGDRRASDSSQVERTDLVNIAEGQSSDMRKPLAFEVPDNEASAPRTWVDALNDARQAVWDAVTLKRCYNRTDSTSEAVEPVASPITSPTRVDAFAAWKQKGWDTLTLKPCWTAAAVEKTFHQKLAEETAAHRTKEALANRTCSQFLSQLFGCSKLDAGLVLSYLHHGLNATRSGELTAEAFKKIIALPNSKLNKEEGTTLEAFQDKISQVRGKLADSSLKNNRDKMLALLDEFGIAESTEEAAEKYSNNKNERIKFIYYVVKHLDTDEPMTEDKLQYIDSLLSKTEESSTTAGAASVEESPIIAALRAEVNRFWAAEVDAEEGIQAGIVEVQDPLSAVRVLSVAASPQQQTSALKLLESEMVEAMERKTVM